MTFNSQFSRYADIMATLPAGFANNPGLPETLKMASDQRHEVFYAPFDHVNPAARIVLVGITPGRTQAVAAIEVARRALLQGKSQIQAAEEAKGVASFSGALRKNLVDLLDYVGLAQRLGLASTAALWTTHSHLVHFTSALRYPVFRDGERYSGSGLVRSSFLRRQLEEAFAVECDALKGALFVPLGPAATDACHYVAKLGRLRKAQILTGLPHPSPASAERIAYFLGRKPVHLLSTKTPAHLWDARRESALKCVEGWS